ncbi:MAG: DNA topoisomerase, partial [Bacteroidia bacterium]
KIKSGLSAGRVQSVAVRLIVEREREVREFKAVSSYRVTAELLTEKGELVKAELIKRFDKIEEAKAFLESCIKAIYTVSKLETKPTKKSPAPPFITSTLQQEASRKLSFSVKKTMKVAQDLYESGRITYMRTDSTNLSDTALKQAEDAITQMFGANYHQRRQYKTKNNSAQEAHEAIRPTDFSVASISASNDEQRLYELIWKRATASQMADAQLEKTVADITISTNKAVLQATGEVIKFDGFLKLYLESKDDEDEEEGSNLLPPLQVGQNLSLKEMVALERYSRPNARYTEAALVKKMEELGIGRPSTYAPTISTIQDRQYVLKDSKEGVKRDLNRLSLAKDVITQSVKSEVTGTEKNKLFPTDLGKTVTEFLVEAFQNVLDYSFTAKVEVEFDQIAEGKLVWQKMIGDFYTPFAAKVSEVGQDKTRVKTERLLGVDAESGKNVYAKIGPFGPMIQIGETSDEEKPRFASMRKDQIIEDITLQEAMGLFVLPRTLGEHNGKAVKSAIGRFGPYIQVGSEFASINKEKEREGITAYNVSLEQALAIFVAKQEADANKIIKTYTGSTGAKIVIARGKWNRPYLRYEKDNVPLDKGVDAEALSLEDCERIYAEWVKANPPKKAPAKAAKKK